MKIVFMGTPAFAAKSLQKLIDEGYEIPLVVTQPDRKGNRNKMVLSEVRKLAIGHGIETAQPVQDFSLIFLTLYILVHDY